MDTRKFKRNDVMYDCIKTTITQVGEHLPAFL